VLFVVVSITLSSCGAFVRVESYYQRTVDNMISTFQPSSIVVSDKPDTSGTIRGAGGDLTNATNVYDATSRRKEGVYTLYSQHNFISS
jgi:hypothetical protein